MKNNDKPQYETRHIGIVKILAAIGRKEQRREGNPWLSRMTNDFNELRQNTHGTFFLKLLWQKFAYQYEKNIKRLPDVSKEY